MVEEGGEELAPLGWVRLGVPEGGEVAEEFSGEPELREALAQRAEHDHETTSFVIRKALREYLRSPSSKL